MAFRQKQRSQNRFFKNTTRFYIKANNSKDEIEKFVDFIEKHCPVHDTWKTHRFQPKFSMSSIKTVSRSSPDRTAVFDKLLKV